jgi:hypothetical protein
MGCKSVVLVLLRQRSFMERPRETESARIPNQWIIRWIRFSQVDPPDDCKKS